MNGRGVGHGSSLDPFFLGPGFLPSKPGLRERLFEDPRQSETLSPSKADGLGCIGIGLKLWNSETQPEAGGTETCSIFRVHNSILYSLL